LEVQVTCEGVALDAVARHGQVVEAAAALQTVSPAVAAPIIVVLHHSICQGVEVEPFQIAVETVEVVRTNDTVIFTMIG